MPKLYDVAWMPALAGGIGESVAAAIVVFAMDVGLCVGCA